MAAVLGSVDIIYKEKLPGKEVSRVYATIKSKNTGSVKSGKLELKTIHTVNLTPSLPTSATKGGSLVFAYASVDTAGSPNNYAILGVLTGSSGADIQTLGAAFTGSLLMHATVLGE